MAMATINKDQGTTQMAQNTKIDAVNTLDTEVAGE